jgi:transcriptional regulator with XRE-family HTH domain
MVCGFSVISLQLIIIITKKYNMDGLRIKEILKQQGKTMQELADVIGINRVNLSNSLNGNPTLERLKQVADCLDVDVKDLFISTKSTPLEIIGIIKCNGEIFDINNFNDLERTYLSIKNLFFLSQ